MSERDGADFQTPLHSPSFSAPRLGQEIWYLHYSTRLIWMGKQNIQVEKADDKNESRVEALTYSYQDLDSSEVNTMLGGGGRVLIEGRDGKLLSWMMVTDLGIEDDSEKDLGPETLHDIVVTIENMEDVFGLSGKVEIFQVTRNGARDEQRKRQREEEQEKWRKRTGPEAGISPNLVYDDEDPKERLKCAIQ
ncbi:hypothetical protein VTL71DRAFT_5973 [Oculimacula yallundae]|uniref:Uncharacterized protein n=1 Tax=Oculimacula yallundae TaxID=86028 RepID=A0ABR4C073_9HELO